MIRIELEFHSVPEAIIALNAVMNLPAAKVVSSGPNPASAGVTEKIRRGRADKGQKRGEYKPRAEPAPPAAAEVLLAAPSVEASLAEVVKGEIQAQQRRNDPPGAPKVVIGDKDTEAQAAVQKIFETKGIEAVRDLLARYGVSRVREVLAEKRADFLAEAAKVAA